MTICRVLYFIYCKDQIQVPFLGQGGSSFREKVGKHYVVGFRSRLAYFKSKGALRIRLSQEHP